MKPLIHAQSSAKQYGGSPEEYLAVHDLMDSSKAVISDNRHRLLTHQAWFLFIAEKIIGHSFTNSEDRQVSIRDLAEMHCLEDFSMRFIPTAEDYLRLVPRKEWMKVHLDSALDHAKLSVKEFGGEPSDYLSLHRLLNSSSEVMADERHRALTHQSFFIERCQDVFGPTIGRSEAPTKAVAELHIKTDFGFLPSAQEWLEEMRYADWLSNGLGDPPPSARLVADRRKSKSGKTVFTFD
jgi:hypothetical protein